MFVSKIIIAIEPLAKDFVVFALTPLAIILRLFGIRFARSGTDNRIGHLICEPLYMELLRRQGEVLHKHFIMLIPPLTAANDYVLEVLPNTFTVIRNPLLCKLLSPFRRHPLTRVDMYSAIATTSGSAKIFKHTHLISNTEPFLAVPRLPDERVASLLKDLGLSSDNWYVCFHNRERGYSLSDDDFHDYRNGTVGTFKLAIEYIVSQGGSVIRMGDPSMTRLPELEGVVDYAHSPHRSPTNDLILSANCRFFLGNSSGAFTMAACQGVPIVAVNMAPMGACKAWGPNDIAIPKIYRRMQTNKILPFSQIFDSDLADIQPTSNFRERGVYLEENTADEIFEAVREMVLRLDGQYLGTPLDDSLQEEFLSLFRSNNYSYFSQTRISSYFLRKYSELLPEVQQSE